MKVEFKSAISKYPSGLTGRGLGKLPIGRHKGFSLTELMIVIVLVAILLAIGVPSYQTITNRNRIAYEVNDLRGYIEMARSEAMKQGLSVVLCPSSNGSSCGTGTSWASGWLMYTTTGDCTGAISSKVKVRNALSSTDTLVFSASGTNTTLCFNRIGMLSSGYSGWFSFNTSNSDASFNRCISMSAAGQAKVLRHGDAVSATKNCS